MPAKQLTKSPNEADLEASIHQAVKQAFPWLAAGSIRHQTKFAFTFGRKKIEIDGTEVSRAEGRSDIILYNEERPLAVLELKRPGIPLTGNDEAQGLSYARVLTPSPPLVIVTNGTDLHIVETHSGKKWAATLPTDQDFKALVSNAARVATADLKDAIDTLMGTNSAVWMSAARSASAVVLSELSASSDKPAQPFVDQILFSRRATLEVLSHIRDGAKLVLLEGPPLAGKSNVLREIVLKTEVHPDIAALYLEAGVGRGIVQAVADSLTNALEWTVSTEDARVWLRRLSKSTDRKLLLLVDGLAIDDNDARKEIEDLTSSNLGSGVTIVAALDDTVAEQIVLRPNHRTQSTIGRRAKRVAIKSLDDREFEYAKNTLWQHRIGFMHGADFEDKLRQPWVLRAMCEPLLNKLSDTEPDHGLLLPSVISLELIRHARERFVDPDLRRQFNAIAKAVLADATDQSRDVALKLESLAVNLLRRETLLHYLTLDDLKMLIDGGFLKSAMHTSDDAILYVRLPELLASELARLLAKKLIDRRNTDQHEAAMWLAGAASNFPMGDLIAAQAVLDAAQTPEGITFALIRALIESPPTREVIHPGSRFAMHVQDVGRVEISIKADGKAEMIVWGQAHEIQLNENELGETYAQYHQWLILSHLAEMHCVIEDDDGEKCVNHRVLFEVGRANIVLREFRSKDSMRGLPTHNLPGIGSIVCHKAGIVEPITLSICHYLSREVESRDEWIDLAIESKSMPLLARIHIALLQIASEVDEQCAPWARQTLETRVRPAFNFFPQLHIDEELDN
ncbi:type I restriction enzyme HsdR N-terminal domain-containing protein [Aquitalea aquatilis]|uniref:type I restriction enzyme HsdR N-terminal domain-containing protein n=1 Tax=Aquitalea aquatilis TaxID=1537400 RepID=UPI0010BD152B|nr:type I restriction enzyme HsdR N-terminal domain-containing protein [Aquitalea aquatilis]